MKELMQLAYAEMENLDENEIEELKAKGRRYAVEAASAMSNAMDSVVEKMNSEDSFIVTVSYFDAFTELMSQMAPTEEGRSDVLNLIAKHLR